MYNRDTGMLEFFNGNAWAAPGGGGVSCFFTYGTCGVTGFTAKKTGIWFMCSNPYMVAYMYIPNAGGCPNGWVATLSGPWSVCCNS